MDKELEAYDEYAKEGDEVLDKSNTDYAVLMRDVLNKIKDEAEASNLLNITNLSKTAIDYLFYLEDNRRVII